MASILNDGLINPRSGQLGLTVFGTLTGTTTLWTAYPTKPHRYIFDLTGSQTVVLPPIRPVTSTDTTKASIGHTLVIANKDAGADILTIEDSTNVTITTINPGDTITLSAENDSPETWRIVSVTGTVAPAVGLNDTYQVGDNTVLMNAADGPIILRDAAIPIGTVLIAEDNTSTYRFLDVSQTYFSALGSVTPAVGSFNTAIGFGADSTGATNSVVIGTGPTCSVIKAVAIGNLASVTAPRGTAIGKATASGNDAVAIGTSTQALGANSVAIGGHVSSLTVAGNAGSIAVGFNTQSNGAYGISIGSFCNDNSVGGCIVMGVLSAVTAGTLQNSISMGIASVAGNVSGPGIAIGQVAGSTGAYSIAIGGQPTATDTGTIAIGRYTVASGANAIAIGGDTTATNAAEATAARAVAIGFDATAGGVAGVCIGDVAKDNSVAGCVVIGDGATITTATAANSVAIGTAAVAGNVGGSCIAIGQSAAASGASSISIGGSGNSRKDGAVTLGYAGQSYGTNSTSLGRAAWSQATSSIALGYNSRAWVNNTIAIGENASADAIDGIAIGRNTVSRSATQEVTSVTVNAGLATTGAGNYFLLYTPGGTEYYVWYNFTDGSNTDPAVAGKIGIKVDVLVADTLNNIASKTVTAVGTGYAFTAAIGAPANVVLITCIPYGLTTDSTAGTTPFTVTTTQQGISSINSIAIGIGATTVGDAGIAIGSEDAGYGAAGAYAATHAIAIGSDALATATTSICIGTYAKDNGNTSMVTIGTGAVATGGPFSHSIAIGTIASVSNANCIAMGQQSVASGQHGISLGTFSLASNTNAIAIGGGSTSSANAARAAGLHAIAIGERSYAQGTDGVCIGSGAIDNGATGGVIIGDGTSSGASSPNSVALGTAAFAGGIIGSVVAIGNNASATGSYAVSVGANTVSSNTETIAIGRFSGSTSTYAISIGSAAASLNTDTIAIGRSTTASGIDGICIGAISVSSNTEAIAIGRSAVSTGTYTVSLGARSSASNVNAIAIGGASIAGQAARAAGARSVAIGFSAYAQATGSVCIGDVAVDNNTPASVVIGDNARVNSGATLSCVVIGENCSAGVAGGPAIAIGRSSVTAYGIAIGLASTTASGTQSIAIGRTAAAFGGSGIAIGAIPTAVGDDSIAIGGQASTSGLRAIAIGRGPSAQAGGIAIGDACVSTGTGVIIGNGSAAGECVAIRATASALRSFAAMGSTASNDYAIAIGYGATASGTRSIAIGGHNAVAATATGSFSVAINGFVYSDTACAILGSAKGVESVALGRKAQTVQGGCIAIGGDSTTSQPVVAAYTNAIAIGSRAIANADRSISIGEAAFTNYRSTAIGYLASSTAVSSVAIGNTATAVGGLVEITDITVVMPLATTGTASYFLLNSPGQEFYVWYFYGFGTTTDPAITGKTGIGVTLVLTDTATDVATKTAATLTGASYPAGVYFVSSSLGTVVTVQGKVPGSCINASAGTTSFTFLVTQNGTDKTGATAIGFTASATNDNSIAIGTNSIGRIDNTIVMSGAHITRKVDVGEIQANAHRYWTSVKTSYTTEIFVLTGNRDFIIPAGAMFFPDSYILSDTYGTSLSITFSIGTETNNALYVGSTATTLTAFSYRSATITAADLVGVDGDGAGTNSVLRVNVSAIAGGGRPRITIFGALIEKQ